MKTALLTKTALLASLTSALAFLVIPLPFSPVPITGQTLGVMLSGLLLGPFYGGLSMLLYIGLGTLGLPVFAGGTSGIGALFGPSGGYLWGFLLGSVITGLIFQKIKSPKGEKSRFGHDYLKALLAALAGGVVCVHIVGVSYLAITIQKSWGQAFVVGTLPFLPGDILKAFVASTVAPRLWRKIT